VTEELKVGERLKAAREQAGLSQRELARRVHVRNSTISLIEAGRMNPSIGALKRIIDGIPLSIAAFFMMDIEEDAKFFYQAEDLTEIGKGAVSFQQVGKRSEGRKLQMLWERYDPGSDTGTVLLTHEGEEAGFIISGWIELTVANQKKILGSGSAYAFASTLPHRFRNTGAEVCIIVSACTPPSF
jgi:transcriptional regulator with XRE-family HTH domain